jgi:hypothetical protein
MTPVSHTHDSAPLDTYADKRLMDLSASEFGQLLSSAFDSSFDRLSRHDPSEEVAARFWLAGYQHFAKHTRDDASRWAGSRLLAWVGGILIAYGIYLATKAGVIK